MSLIPNESYSFPDHFVQTIAQARKSMRQTSPSPDPEPQPNMELSPSFAVPDPPVETTSEEPMLDEPLDRRSTAQPNAFLVRLAQMFRSRPSDVISEPPSSSPEQELPQPVAPETSSEPPIMFPTEPQVLQAALEQEPEGQFLTAEDTEPQMFLPSEPESYQLLQETPPPQRIIRSVVPPTVKRKLRWNRLTAARNQENLATSNGQPAASLNSTSAEPRPMPPFPLPSASRECEVRPEISPAAPTENFVTESAIDGFQTTEPFSEPATEQGSRTVDAPSADLVQTLLARALFASSETTATPAPLEDQTINFAPEIPAMTPNEFPSTAQEVRPMLDETPPAAPVEAVIPPISRTKTLVGKRRYSLKMRRFLICEGVAVGILVPFAILGVLRVFQQPIAVLFIDVTTITSAVAATIMPILFFAIAPPLPRGED